MADSILILNGPNLNMLGTREADIYGTQSLADIDALCHAEAKRLGLEAVCVQSNDESAMVEAIQQAKGVHKGIIINAAAYTHSSVAIHDALRLLDTPIIEVHLSNIYQRESFRHHSYVSPVATGVICGLGAQGYVLALQAMQPLI